MKTIYTQKEGGWVLGDFVEDSNLRNSNNLSVKWVVHPENYKRESGADFSKKEKTMVVLISGELKVSFGGKDIILSKTGDYVVFGPLQHTTEAIKESRVVAFRWIEQK